ncbi:endoglucanase [uncultured Methanobrevibacter sp.]|uniref:endoglucanase n=1 Tax=uncultured Methanobrevibacter sp. TaxID=253161 RepID=UPI0026009579|nr:endoglucanase [uncultured Methanobrevibacter sp.]
MDKANIIISIIVVLCIAAAVTAYGITNSDNPIFSDLSSMGANDNTGNGLGNNTTLNNTGSSVATTDGSSSSTGSESGSSDSYSSGSSSSGSSSGSSSSSSSGSSSSSDSGSDSGSSSNTQMSYSTAKSIANDAVLEDRCYAGSGYYSNGYWIFTIYDADGNAVDSIGVNDATGGTERV